ncbi:hypothetical protein MPC1_4880005 [Methylocella tundrae]|nr:hypothetical protein MPC1_4880005 [Methylocella tundrae]
MGVDKHGAPARRGFEGRAPARRHPAWPLENHDLRGGVAAFRYGFADGPRRADQPRCLPGLCRSDPRSRTQPGRRRDHGRSWQPQGPAIRAAIGAAGARLLFLPPYSPDFNPIENAFSKLKAHL